MCSFFWSKIDFILMSSAHCKLVISQHISAVVNFLVVLHHFKWQGPWVFLQYEFQPLSSWSFHLCLAVFVQKHMSKPACWWEIEIWNHNLSMGKCTCRNVCRIKLHVTITSMWLDEAIYATLKNHSKLVQKQTAKIVCDKSVDYYITAEHV